MNYQVYTTNANITFQSTPPNQQYSQVERSIGNLIVSFLLSYVTPLIVSIGIPGNCVCIIIFSDKSLRRLSSSVYVQAVLVSDTTFLLTLLALWLESLGYNAIHMNYICQGNVYLSYVGSFLSVWYVVCITIENYITICHPLKINTLCTFPRAIIVSLSLALVSLIIFVVVIPITQPQETGQTDPSDNSTVIMMCVTSFQYTDLMNIFSYIDSVIAILIPMIIILICLTFIIIATLKSLQNKRKRMAYRENVNTKLADVPQVRVAKLLSVISISYIILNLPSHIIRLLYLFCPQFFVPLSVTTLTVHQSLLYLSYLSYALKFFIFFIFSGNFRKLFLGRFFCLFPWMAQGTRDIRTTTKL